MSLEILTIKTNPVKSFKLVKHLAGMVENYTTFIVAVIRPGEKVGISRHKWEGDDRGGRA